MIELNNISKSFGNTHALKNVSMHLKAGKFFGLIGPNACGKTTIIKSILNMVVPSAGSILFDSKSIKGDVSYKNHIGYMPQIGRYPENMSIKQVIFVEPSRRQPYRPPGGIMHHNRSAPLNARTDELKYGTHWIRLENYVVGNIIFTDTHVQPALEFPCGHLDVVGRIHIARNGNATIGKEERADGVFEVASAGGNTGAYSIGAEAGVERPIAEQTYHPLPGPDSPCYCPRLSGDFHRAARPV